MYKIIIINGSTQTTIHHPNPDENVPKVEAPHINKARGQAQQLTFSIYPNNPGFNLLIRMATRVKVIDTRDNSETFAGRVYTAKFSYTKEKGLFKEVVCEGELNYLQDTVQDSVIYEDKTAQQMLQIFLDYHNSIVEDYKKIYLGNVTVTDWKFCTTNNESTLECIQKYVYDENLGYLQLRKENGINYLDYLVTTNDKVIDATLGQNLLSLVQTDDADFGTYIVPVGANGLTIDNVNSGKKYLIDEVAVAKYGVIFKTVQYSDIDDDTELMERCQAELSNYTSPKKSLELDVADLAALANVSTNMIDENTSVHVKNSLMNIDETWEVIVYDVDLAAVYQPKVTLSNKATSLTGTLSSIVGSMVRNDDSYNGVQIGDSFGIRVKKNDVVTLLNATDGISITNGGVKVFYVGADGNLVTKSVTSIDMVAQEMRTSNTTNYIIFHDQYIEFYQNGKMVMQIGSLSINGDLPSIMFPTSAGDIMIFSSNSGLNISGPTTFQNGLVNFLNGCKINGYDVATQKWTTDKGYIDSSALSSALSYYAKLSDLEAALTNYISKEGSTVNLPNGMSIVCSGDQIDFYSSDGTKIFGANKTSIAGHVPAGGAYQSVQS